MIKGTSTMSLFVIVVLYLVCLQRPVFAENVMPSDIGESYIIQDTVENVSADILLECSTFREGLKTRCRS